MPANTAQRDQPDREQRPRLPHRHAENGASPLWTLTAPVKLTGQAGLGIPHVAEISSPTVTLYSHTFTLATAPITTSAPPPPPPPPVPAWTLSILGGTGTSGEPSPGPATQSELGDPTDVATDAHGDAYVTDLQNDVVEEITPAGQLSVIAGEVGQSGTPTPGPATDSDLDLNGVDGCGGVAVDQQGDVYIADCGNDVVEKVTPNGQLSIVAGQPADAGAPTPGPATQSLLDNPSGVAVDASGNVYIADGANDVIEKVTPGGTLSIVAGEVGVDGEPSPGPANNTTIGSGDIAVDPAGNIFYADTENNLVEEINTAGQLSIVAGVEDDSGSPVAGPATQSPLDFDNCGQVAVSAADELFIADCSNDAVESVTPSGAITVIAGTPGESGTPVPGNALDSFLSGPAGIAVEPSGVVLVADSDNADLEQLTPAQ